VNGEFAACGICLEAGDRAEMFDDSGEHDGYRSKIADLLEKGKLKRGK
jgi:hypothetical protein